MLTEQEQKEIAKHLEMYPTKRAACIEAMMVVQKHRGWVSDENILDIAGCLEMSAADLDGVATFYNLIHRKPVGRHVIIICDSVSCWITGYEGLRDHLKKRLGIDLGQTTPDNRFTLLPNVCLGACDRAPVMMVDDDLHTDLDPDKIDRILEDYQ